MFGLVEGFSIYLFVVVLGSKFSLIPSCVGTQLLLKLVLEMVLRVSVTLFLAQEQKMSLCWMSPVILG